MGLDIGIITIEYLKRPSGIAYEFAQEMAVEASVNGYMAGADNNWAPFTQRQVLNMLGKFVKNRGLSRSERRKVLRWIRSLPWEGWRKNLRAKSGKDADDSDARDYQAEGEEGIIELHFWW